MPHQDLTTPLITDACLRTETSFRMASPDMSPLVPEMRMSGPVVAVRHSGSVDVFLEAIESGKPGDVLVVDNQGRHDEGCLGDLVILEAQLAGFAGCVVWGRHRDSQELREIGLPLFSLGAFAVGPQRLDPRPANALEEAVVGDVTASRHDYVFADEDGVVFLEKAKVETLVGVADEISVLEKAQARRMRGGQTLRDQLRFGEYLESRERDPSWTFRKHLRQIGGAIEE